MHISDRSLRIGLFRAERASGPCIPARLSTKTATKKTTVKI